MAYPYYPNYNQLFYQQQLQNLQQQQNAQASNQIQNTGFVMVKDVNEAMNYPVAPGNSVTFKNETQPYIYTKTLGFSQLDQPIFETFKLVKEENVEKTADPIVTAPIGDYLSLEAAETMKEEIKALRSEIEFLKEYLENDVKEETEDGHKETV